MNPLLQKFRNVKEETACNEMMVSVNGPAPSKSKPVVMAAMKRHFKGPNGIRFTKRSNDIRLFDTAGSAGVSKVITKMLRENSRLPFMQ